MRRDSTTRSAPRVIPIDPALRRLRALSDRELVLAMREGDALAFAEYAARYRPLLEGFARRTKIPTSDWPACLDETIEDTALLLARRGATIPASLGGYLVRAVRNRFLMECRSRRRRERLHRDALVRDDTVPAADAALASVLSEHAVRTSHGPLLEGEPATDTTERKDEALAARLATALRDALPEADTQLLAWTAEYIPHRQIAEWMARSYEATTKRSWRLMERLRPRALAIIATWPLEEQRRFHRLFVLVDARPSDETEPGDRRDAGGQ